MKKHLGLIWMMVVILGLCGIHGSDVMAYTIDGIVTDWGIDLPAGNADQKGYLDNNHPSGGWDIDYTTEDNADKYKPYWTKVGPLWSYKNYFDAEAIYFDNDQYNAYIAIIQGLPSDGNNPPGNTAYNDPNYKFKPGDIAIDADNDVGTGKYGYEYGLDISSHILYNVTQWKGVIYNGGSSANPWAINSGTEIGSVDFFYSANQNSHYVLEAAIPLSYLGLDANSVHNLRIHWTQECGNDYLTLNADVNPAPEPATLLLMGSGLIGLGCIGRRKFKKN